MFEQLLSPFDFTITNLHFYKLSTPARHSEKYTQLWLKRNNRLNGATVYTAVESIDLRLKIALARLCED